MEINSAWFEMLDDFIKSQGIPTEIIFTNEQQYHEWKQSTTVDYSELKQCLARLVEHCHDYTSLFMVVDNLTPMNFGTVGVMLASAPDLRTMLKLIPEFQMLFGSSIRTVYRENAYGDGNLLFIDQSNQANALQVELITLYGAALLKFIRLCCGDPNLKVHFKVLNCYISAEHLEQFKQITHCEIDFGHSIRRISINREHLYKPLKHANPSLHVVTKKLAYDELKTSVNSNIIALTYKAFHELGLSKANQESVAHYLNISPRSYSRKLKSIDTSFSEVLKQYRLEFVFTEFDSRKDNLTQIAYQLGFSDLSSFSHAFKRWTGISPRQALEQYQRQ
ncbi:helix-turn-helix domain-containing protein [Vibrio astriarenae]